MKPHPAELDDSNAVLKEVTMSHAAYAATFLCIDRLPKKVETIMLKHHKNKDIIRAELYAESEGEEVTASTSGAASGAANRSALAEESS